MAKKSLTPKRRIFEKIDGAFHNLFFDNRINFNEVSLEVIVEDNVQGDYHDISTRGNYVKQKRSVAFRRINDSISWEYSLSLANDYAAQIAKALDSSVYTAEKEADRLLIKAGVSREEITRAISAYINEQGGYLEQRQFMDLTGGAEVQLVQLFGPEHDTIVRRQYSTADVLRFSREFFRESIPRVVKRARFWETRNNHSANIINIYRKILNYNKPEPQQKELF